MGVLLNLSHHPPVTVSEQTSVLDAVLLMSANRVGAVSVVDAEGRLVGIFSERDVMERVVKAERSPRDTRMRDVMTSSVESAPPDGNPAEALERMVGRHIRHLPIADESRRVLGMLSIRNLLQNQFEKARAEAESLEAYLSADGPGG